MKIPAIRAHIGDWIFYSSILTFKQIEEKVKSIDDELHKSNRLSEMIQRSISNNHKEITKYILNQNERFFNSLVLALYDGNPQWIEVEHRFGNEEFYNMGFLDLNGSEKIFPVDGQHRVEGIKKALLTKPELNDEKISVIIIAHKNDKAGMQRSRRLFTTLNRYRKPVTLDDIIALDEDDTIAIITRRFLEEFNLFSNNRISINKQKAIPSNDKTAITSIITLYQCNRELIKLFFNEIKGKIPDDEKHRKKKFDDYLKFRPNNNEIEKAYQLCLSFWKAFRDNIDKITDYSSNQNENPAKEYRNRETGGHLLFRPVGLLPFVKAVVEIKKKEEISFEQIIKKINKIDFSLNKKPWLRIVWSPNDKKMIMGTQGLVKSLLLYKYSSEMLSKKGITTMLEQYASKTAYEGDDLEKLLIEI